MFYRGIEAETQRSVRSFSKPCRSNSFPECRSTLLKYVMFVFADLSFSLNCVRKGKVILKTAEFDEIKE